MIVFQQMKHQRNWQDSWHSYFEACKQYEQDTQNTMQHLLDQRISLYHTIHSLVSTEENESIQFVDRIEALTEKVLQINAEIDQLDHVKKTIANNRDRLKHFPTLLKTLQPFEPETGRIPFRRDIFESAVQSIHMMSKGKILVDFIFDQCETVVVKGYFPHKLPMRSQ